MKFLKLIKTFFLPVVILFLQTTVAHAGNNDVSISDWGRFFFTSWGIPFTVYLVLQIAAILHLEGGSRKAVLVPLAIMAIVVIITMIAYQQESNLWPIYLIFSSPFAAIAVGIIWLSGLKNKE